MSNVNEIIFEDVSDIYMEIEIESKYDIIEEIAEFICPISKKYFLEPVRINGVFIERTEIIKTFSLTRQDIDSFEVSTEFNDKLKIFYENNPIYLIFRYNK